MFFFEDLIIQKIISAREREMEDKIDIFREFF